jgi:UDP-perosamine 4-acetyltransferase
VLGVPYWGDDNQLPRLYADGIRCAFVALGSNQLRAKLMHVVCDLGFELANAISRTATISSSCRLGRGIAVMSHANLGPDSYIGDGVIVNSHASIDHDGRLGHCCHIGPGATLAGCVTVESGAFVATGASVIPECRIGARSIVGAGAVVVADIPSDVVAYGVPARPQRSLAAQEATATTSPVTAAATSSDERPALKLVC